MRRVSHESGIYRAEMPARVACRVQQFLPWLKQRSIGVLC